MFSYIQLVVQYIVKNFKSKSKALAAFKAFYWLLTLIMTALMVAYVFEILCWLILGSVINPNKFMPYRCAAMPFVLARILHAGSFCPVATFFRNASEMQSDVSIPSMQ